MATLVAALAVLLGLLAGFAVGFAGGSRVRGRSRRYWALNAVAVLVCMVADFAGLVLGWPALAYGALGAMGGAITGLKYGYAESIGVWRAVDRFTGTAPPEAADEPERQDDPAAG